jgi:translation initiation factor 4E
MEHLLETPWTLYVTKQRTTQGHEKHVKEWEDRLTTIHTFSSIEAFWSVQNNLRSPSEMAHESGDFYVFRENILPEWEDAMNAGGGRWIIMSDASRVENEWVSLLLSLIGNLYEDLADAICGAELAVRPKKRYKIAVWVKMNNRETVMRIGNMIKEILKVETLEYQKHKAEKPEIRIG